MKNWFDDKGAYMLIDGQFGSTGKGLLAGYLAEKGAGRITHVTTNAGPNSGHTAYFRHVDNPAGIPTWECIITKQIPIASIFLEKLRFPVVTILNAGAIIDHQDLASELNTWMREAWDKRRIWIHPNAAAIDHASKEQDKLTTSAIAGTGKGVGPAIQRKIGRLHGDAAIAKFTYLPIMGEDRRWETIWNWDTDCVFVETAQGFSLSINNSLFYPNVTSRECTVMQALADARIPPQMLRKTVVCLRTYPIRVGDTENTSGGWYPDQHEVSWESIGQKPELTTVTRRVRRVATFSMLQYTDMLEVNRPTDIFLNFCNYLSWENQRQLIASLLVVYRRVMGRQPDNFLLGFGPRSSDIKTLAEWEQN